MKKSKIILYIIPIIFFVFITFGNENIFHHNYESQWETGFCYKFFISNPSQVTLFDWEISFKIVGNTHISSNWGGILTNNGTNYTIKGLSRNEVIPPGTNNIEIGFCANTTEKIQDVYFAYASGEYIVPTGEPNSSDLANYIDDIFLNNVSNKSCENMFFLLEDSIKNEIIDTVLEYENSLDMAQYFFHTLSYEIKYDVVKNTAYELIKDILTAEHTETQKSDFYTLVYTLSEENITHCVTKNTHTEIRNFLEKLNEIRKVVHSCSQEGNILKLEFLNSYSIYR